MASNVFKIRTKDTLKRISGVAKKQDLTDYDLDTEVAKTELLIQKPNNGTVTLPLVTTVTNPGSGGADFHYDTAGEYFDEEGYWGFQARYTLTGGQVVDSQIEYIWVGPSLITTV